MAKRVDLQESREKKRAVGCWHGFLASGCEESGGAAHLLGHGAEQTTGGEHGDVMCVVVGSEDETEVHATKNWPERNSVKGGPRGRANFEGITPGSEYGDVN